MMRPIGPRLRARSVLALATMSSPGSSITFFATVTTFRTLAVRFGNRQAIHSCGQFAHIELQGGQDLNLQPAVLERCSTN